MNSCFDMSVCTDGKTYMKLCECKHVMYVLGIYMCVCINVCEHPYACLCVHVNVHVCACVCVCVCVYMRACVREKECA